MKKTVFIVLAFILVLSCSEDNDPNPTNPQESDSNVEVPKIADNVVVISDETSNVISTETDLENGIYIIEYVGDVATVVVNDIIVGDEEDGFLRKVNSVTVSGSTQTMETEQAALDEVFENADLSFNLDLTNLEEVTNKGYQITSNELIYDYVAEGVSFENKRTFSFNMNAISLSKNGLTFKVSGNAAFNPNFNFDTKIRTFSVESVVFEANNANLSLSAGYELSAASSLSVTNDVRLVRMRKRFTFLVGTVPVVVTADVRLNASLNATLDGTFTASGSYTKTYTVDTGVSYKDGQWASRFNTGASTSIDPLSYDAAINLTETLTITPNVQIKFYGVVAPYIEPEMFAQYKMNMNVIDQDWDSSFGVGLNLTTGVKGLIFGKSLFDFARTGNYSKPLWDAPKTIEIVSGNKQEGDEEKQLGDPIKLKVLDNLGNPISLVPIHVELVTAAGDSSSSGSIENEVIETNDEGIAELNWTLGKEDDEEGTKRFAKAVIKTSEGEDIGEPIELEAEIIPDKGCNNFVDLSLFNATECGQVVNINNVLVSAEMTTVADCRGDTEGGSCSFSPWDTGIGAAASRILFDIGNYNDSKITEIRIKYKDYCGDECTRAFIYDKSNTVLAAKANAEGSEEGEFKFVNSNVLEEARFVVFSSCEGVLRCFDMTFEE